MRDPDWEAMDEQEFEALLESSVDQPPPEVVVAQVTPWRLATKRILTGIGLTTVTLNFWWLNYLLPTIGMALMLLGFRALRRENRWLGLCFGITLLRAVYLYATLVLNSTIWSSTVSSCSVLYGSTGLNLILTFVQFFFLWGGFRAVQQKAGLPPHAGPAVALLIWYGITGLLAAVQYNGLILPLALLICYICILRSLWKLSKQLDQAGYAIRPAPVRVTDTVLSIAIAAVVLIGCTCGLLLGCKYPMDWQAADPNEHSGVEEIEAQLLELGFPDYVLDDLAAEDIAADSIFWGEQTSTDLFAAFSMPHSGGDHRGYLAYPIEEVQPGHLLDSCFNYTHQRTALQYPAMTAMEYRMSGAWDRNGPFLTIQDALQFYPAEEDWDLLSE